MNSNIKKNRLILAIITISLVGLIGIGMSYAYWRSTVIQDKTNVGASKCFSIELANQANEINLTNAYPITDAEGRKLTPYTFTLKNTCSMAAKYNLNMEMLSGTTLNSSYVAVLVNNNDIRLLSSYNAATTVIEGSTESRTLDTGTLAGNSSKDYSISLWIDEDVTLEDDILNKVFKSKIVVDAVPTQTAMEKIIASVDTTGKCPTINSDGSVNVTGVEATDGYVCSASDAYGTSYYYRGNVTNNYVKFADKYWRIIRINGDGTVRVIYDGTSAHTNGESSADRQIGTSAFNNYWKKDNVQETTNSGVYGDNAGVGYMYGNRDAIVEATSSSSSISFTNTDTYYIAKEYTYDATTDRFTLKDPIAVLGSAMTSDYIGYYTFGSTSTTSSNSYVYKIFGVTVGDKSASVKYGYVRYGTSSKEVAQTNINDSTIKTYLDNWYKTHISGTENEQYLADNIFCNDRSFASNNSGTGAGVSYSYYRWYNRPWESNNYNKKMMLTCLQQNDAFTVSDTTNGNGALTHPIGLITTDEVVLAGGWSASNNGYYLYSGSWYWASSSYNLDSFNARVMSVYSSGNAHNADDVSTSNGGVRPVINLKAEILAQGSGTATDPYHLSS